MELEFGKLTRDQRINLFTAWVDGAAIEYFSAGLQEWRYIAHPNWSKAAKYRVMPRKPKIDWSHVSSVYNWLAMDENGEHWLYEDKPSIGVSGWVQEGEVAFPDMLASFRKGRCDWMESLIGRDE